MKSLTKNMMLQIGLAVSSGMLVLADPAPEGESSDFPVYEAEDGGTLEVATGDTVGAGQFVGEGTFTKGGAGTLAVKDVVGYTGTVTVASGTLKLTGALPPYEPAMPAGDDCVLHLDALDADTLTLVDHSDGVKRVSEWRSKTANGWRAVPSSDSVGSYPRFAADDGLAGNAASVRMPTYVSMFFEDGEGGRVMATNILSVLWVLGSQEGGGHILGLGQTYDGRRAHFFRGPNSYGLNKDDYLFFSSAHDGARAMEMYRNDMRLCASATWPGGATAATPMNTGLSGGWDYLSGRVNEGTYRNRLAADSLAYDSVTSYRCGNQRLAELLIFERVLTAAEERAASAYLRIKWGLEPTWQRSQTNAFGVVVAKGATLDLGGETQYLASVAGEGTISNGTLLAKQIVLDASGDGLRLDASLDLSATTTICVLDAFDSLGSKTLLTADTIVGTVDGIVLAGVPRTIAASLSVVGSSLVLTAEQVHSVDTLELEDGESLAVGEGETTEVGYVVGEGTFSKGGAGTLAVKDVVGYTGTVTVASGTLKLTGTLPPYEPAMPASDNCVLHLDALDADTLTLVDHSDGVKRVSEWRSKTANGWRAVPSSDSVGSYPRFAADDGLANDAASVRMPTYVSMFFEDGEGGRVMATNILSVLWVLGSQEGGGHILGLGQKYDGRSAHFFRGPNSYGLNKDDYLFFSSAHDGARAMEMYRNDMRLCASATWPGGATAATPMNTGLSGGWDYLSGRVNEGTYRNRLAADSLAYDSVTSYRCGNQRLAELLIFERVLTAAEERAASAYLRIKWGLEPTWQRSQTNALAAVVASGASLDLNGTNTYLRAVGGAGSVVNGDLTASGLIASAGGALSVSGTFTATDGFTVDLSALPAGLGGDLVIMTAAGGIVNAAAIRQAAVITGGYPEARVVVSGNSVVVRLQKPGFRLIYR